MAQTAYTGLQGHGKSYEVVLSVILPNFAKGRRIVTNISGLNVDLIKEYCQKVLETDPSLFGEIISVDHADMIKENFFPREETENPYKKALETCTDETNRAELEKAAQAWRDAFTVRGGDLIIIDECWRFYAFGEKLPKYHLEFFRMHRHFLNPDSGQCCDIVLIVQDIADLNRFIRATVEKSFRMQQHVALGMRDRYVVNIYSGKNQTNRSLLEGGINRKYDPAIFPLYKSHSQKVEGGAGPKEERSDKRGNVFNLKIIKYGIPLAIVWLAGASWYMWKFFHPEKQGTAIVKEAKPGQGMSGSPAPEKKPDGLSDRWSLVGYFVRPGGAMTFVLADGSGRVRYLTDPPAVKFSPGEIELALPDKSIVSRWSGAERVKTGGMGMGQGGAFR